VVARDEVSTKPVASCSRETAKRTAAARAQVARRLASCRRGSRRISQSRAITARTVAGSDPYAPMNAGSSGNDNGGQIHSRGAWLRIRSR
jgi:hypothetical protein